MHLSLVNIFCLQENLLSVFDGKHRHVLKGMYAMFLILLAHIVL